MKIIRKALLICLSIVLCIGCAFGSQAATFVNTNGSGFGPGMPMHFDGEELRMLSNQSASQMMSFVITSKNGSLIVIDGGTSEDAAHLRDVIIEKGGHVSAWFITHPHNDHAGALLKLISEGLNGISVDNVYYNFTSPEWYYANEQSRSEFVESLRSAISRLGDKAHVTHRGDLLDIDGIRVYVMNDPYLVPGSLAINNTSLVLRMQIGQKIVMFLGDLGEDAGNTFLMNHADESLKCDIVQMAHHGQCGVGRNFYEALKPTTCLWCAPAWLYDDVTGRYQTAATRRWMVELGATENYCIKNGDQILR